MRLFVVFFFFCLNSRLISVSNIPKSPVESGQRPSTDIRALTHSEEDTFFFFFFGCVSTSFVSIQQDLLPLQPPLVPHRS